MPCCPQWSVQQTVAHLAGACTDLLAGRLEDAGSPAWTAAQVEAGRGRPVQDLLADWAGTGPRVAAMLAAAPKVMGQVTMDAVSHEYDLREALGLPLPADDPDGDPVLPAAVDWVAPRFVRVAEKAGFPPFRLAVGDRAAWQYREGEPQATATWTDLQTLRALTGRLGLTELRALPWSADPEPWLPAFTWAVFAPATR